jgi:hypothetical protein
MITPLPHQPRLTLAVAVLVLAITSKASATFEKWTLQDGRSLHLEFVRFLKESATPTAEFKRLDGALTQLPLADIIDAHAARIDSDRLPHPIVPAPPHDLEQLDAAIQLLREGKPIPDEQRLKCREIYLAFDKSLHAKDNIKEHRFFSEIDRAAYYVNVAKMALIDPAKYGKWPTHDDSHINLLHGLTKLIDRTGDPFVRFCVILPALDAGDQQYAAEAMNSLIKEDPFLADLAKQRLKTSWVSTPSEQAKLGPFLKATGLK